MRFTKILLSTAVVAAFTTTAAAQTTADSVPATRLAASFTRLAGSNENALALANALRTGTTTQLTYAPAGSSTTPTITTYDPPTAHMGWGNVKIALALAQDQLTRAGITNPTAQQLKAALNGGNVTVTNAAGTSTTTPLRGVLQMRADGMGWGQIAQAGGTKVGPVVSQLNKAGTATGRIPTTSTMTKAANTKSTTTATTAANAKVAVGTTAKAATTAANAKTASGVGVTTGVAGPQHGMRGINTAAGVANTSSSRGLTTAQGALSATHGNAAAARGVVTATGQGAAAVTTAQNGGVAGHGKGQGGEHGKGKSG